MKPISEQIKTPKAKLSPILTQTRDLLRGAHLQKETDEVFGVKFTLRTLEPFEEDEAASLIGSADLHEAGSKMRKALLACALVAVDGQPVEQAWALPDELAPDVRKALEVPAVQTDWRRREILEWLNSSSVELIDKLWDYYLGMLFERRQGLEQIRPLSKADSKSAPESNTSGPS